GVYVHPGPQFSSFAHLVCLCFFFSSRRRHTRSKRDWSSDVCSSDLSPGNGLKLPEESEPVPDQPSLTDVILNIFPDNIFQAFIDSNILAIVFISLAIGFILSFMAESNDTLTANRGKLVFDFVAALEDVTFRFLNAVLQYAPIGVFALIATTVGEQSFS